MDTRTVFDRIADFIYYRSQKFYSAWIWPLLPEKGESGVFNGVTIGWEEQHLGEQYFPFESPASKPSFKGPNIAQIRDCVEEGDSVVVIGGGYGITSVAAARETGRTGRVDIFEPAEDRISIIRDTLNRNGVDGICTVHHAAVGPVYGIGRNDLGREEMEGIDESGVPDDDVATKRVSPGSLPECDVLEMDCEGAEMSILESLAIRPRYIIVENHHHTDSSPYSSADALRSAMVDLGYTVSEHGGTPESPKVLTARRKDTA